MAEQATQIKWSQAKNLKWENDQTKIIKRQHIDCPGRKRVFRVGVDPIGSAGQM